MQPFYNTTELSGDSLKDAIKRAKNQEAVVLAVFKDKRRKMGVSDVVKVLDGLGYKYIKVSIGRAMCNLCKTNDLHYLSELQAGMHGSPEHLHQLNYIKHPLPQGVQQEIF